MGEMPRAEGSGQEEVSDFGSCTWSALLTYSFLPEDRRPVPTPEIAEELSANPLHKVKFRKVKVSGEVDRRAVVNPQQARALLAAVSYVGKSRGPMMVAMFACMYFAGRGVEPAQEGLSPPRRGMGHAHAGEDPPGEQ